MQKRTTTTTTASSSSMTLFCFALLHRVVLLVVLLLQAASAAAAFRPDSGPVTKPDASVLLDSIIQQQTKKQPPVLTTRDDDDSANLLPPLYHQHPTKTPHRKNAAASKKSKKWGVDKSYPDEYWFDDRIHTLGNHGFWGAVHAAVAPISTKAIDVLAYNGVDIREQLARELYETVDKQKARIVDLCCGVGFSTRALHKAFSDADCIYGIDTSSEMLAMAEFITDHMAFLQPMFFGNVYEKLSSTYVNMKKKGYALRKPYKVRYTKSNAEQTFLPSGSFDLVTVMYAFHEAPRQGRDRILQEARRLLSPGGTLAIVDIASDYQPSESMLMGEPYVLEYQRNIHQQLNCFPGFDWVRYETVIPHHLGMWTMKRSSTVSFA